MDDRGYMCERVRVLCFSYYVFQAILCANDASWIGFCALDAVYSNQFYAQVKLHGLARAHNGFFRGDDGDTQFQR